MVNRLLFAVLMVAVAFSAWAQSPPPPPGADAPGGASGASGRRDTVRLFVVHKMRENLELTDAQTLKVLDVLEAIDQERAAAGFARRALLDRMQGLLADPASPEPALKEAVAQFQKSQEQNEAKMKELEARLLATLSPKQQVQFIVLRRQLLEEMVREAPRGRAAGRPGGRVRQ